MTKYTWAAVAEEAVRQSPRWVLGFPNHPREMVYTIRYRRVAAMRRDGGRFEATIVNSYHAPGDAVRGDIWVRWVPLTERKEQHGCDSRQDDP